MLRVAVSRGGGGRDLSHRLQCLSRTSISVFEEGMKQNEIQDLNTLYISAPQQNEIAHNGNLRDAGGK